MDVWTRLLEVYLETLPFILILYKIAQFQHTSGFLAYLALNKNVDECAQAGLYCVFENLQQLGCQFPERVNFDPGSFSKNMEDE